MPKPRNYLYTALFLAAMLLWLGFAPLPGPAGVALPEQAGAVYDLATADLTNTVYTLQDGGWETWPEALYTPAQLPAAGQGQPHAAQNFAALPYATHRLTLRLTPGVTYAITGRSSDYAMRLYLNGEEVVAVGNPAETPEGNTPRVRPFAYYFTPQTDTVEIVVQASNHVHYRGGSMAPALTLGTAENIDTYRNNDTRRTTTIYLCLMLPFAFGFIVFLLNHKQRASLLFALLCLAMALLWVEGYATLSPGYNWQLLYRLSYVCTLGATVLLVWLVHTLFPGTVQRPVRLGYTALCGVYLLVALFAPTLLVTRLLGVFWAATAGVIAWCLLCLLVRSLKQRRLKNLLAVLGAGLFGLFAILDLLGRLGLGPAWANAAQGMVLFAACYTLVVAIDQTDVTARLKDAQRELAKAEANLQKLVEEQGNIQTPKQLLAEYGLSTRQIEIALLLLDEKSRAQIADLMGLTLGAVNYHCNFIYKKTGTNGLVGLMGLLVPGRVKNTK